MQISKFTGDESKLNATRGRAPDATTVAIRDALVASATNDGAKLMITGTPAELKVTRERITRIAFASKVAYKTWLTSEGLVVSATFKSPPEPEAPAQVAPVPATVGDLFKEETKEATVTPIRRARKAAANATR
jgi:hypothetical protein